MTLYKRVYPRWSALYKDSRDEMPLLTQGSTSIPALNGDQRGLVEDTRLGWVEMEAEQAAKKDGESNGNGDGDEEMQG